MLCDVPRKYSPPLYAVLWSILKTYRGRFRATRTAEAMLVAGFGAEITIGLQAAENAALVWMMRPFPFQLVGLI